MRISARVRRILSRAACVLCLLLPFSYGGFACAGTYDDFFRAVKMDSAHILRPLLERGLDPNLVEPDRGDTGLILSLRENSMQVFRLLLAAPNIDVEARAMNGDNALMIASFKGNRAAVEALLQRGAEVNKSGWTALHYAAAAGDNAIVQMLLDRAAKIDAESPNGTTPLMMAARGGHIYTVKLLHDSGADATLKNAAGLTAVDFAAQNRHVDIAEGLTYRIARQDRKRKAAEEARRTKEEAVRTLLQRAQPVSLLPACATQGEVAEFYASEAFARESGRSAEPSAESPGDPD